jgi:folate-binding protein YgfZ
MTPTTAIRLTGRDTLDLLHRVTTNVIVDLADGQARGTLFLDFRGRLLHRAVVIRLGDDVWLVRNDAPAAPLLAHLDRQIFREDVKVDDRSADPGLPTVVASEAKPVDERARIEDGRPAHGHEIVDEFNPFEVNLAHEVHLDKGCYTGQEVLQRLVTYESVRRRLVRVEGSGPAPETPSDVNLGDERIGRLTSAVGTRDAWSGLAVVAWTHATNKELAVGNAALTRVEPLPLQRPIGREWAAAG